MTRDSARRWLPALAWYAVISWLSHQPQWPAAARPFPDWLLHLGGYLALGAMLGWAVGPRAVRDRRSVLGLAMLGALAAILDEWHQSWIPGRDASIGDVAADVTGVTLGVLAAVMASFAGLWGLWEDRSPH